MLIIVSAFGFFNFSSSCLCHFETLNLQLIPVDRILKFLNSLESVCWIGSHGLESDIPQGNFQRVFNLAVFLNAVALGQPKFLLKFLPSGFLLVCFEALTSFFREKMRRMASGNLIENRTKQIDVTGFCDFRGQLFFFSIKFEQISGILFGGFIRGFSEQSICELANPKHVTLIKEDASLVNAKLRSSLVRDDLNFSLLCKMLRHFRSHIYQCSSSAKRRPTISKIQCHTKVEQKHLTVIADHNIVRF